VNSRIFTLK